MRLRGAIIAAISPRLPSAIWTLGSKMDSDEETLLLALLLRRRSKRNAAGSERRIWEDPYQ